VEPKFNGTCLILACGDDFNLLGDNVDAVKNMLTLIDASKEVGIETDVEKTTHI
jgi:hypothetical protein